MNTPRRHAVRSPEAAMAAALAEFYEVMRLWAASEMSEREAFTRFEVLYLKLKRSPQILVRRREED